MINIHLAQIAVLEELLVIYLAGVTTVELLHQFLYLSDWTFHVWFWETPYEIIMLNESGAVSIFLIESWGKLSKIIRGNFLAQILECSVLDLGLFHYGVYILDDLLGYAVVSDGSLCLDILDDAGSDPWVS